VTSLCTEKTTTTEGKSNLRAVVDLQDLGENHARDVWEFSTEKSDLPTQTGWLDNPNTIEPNQEWNRMLSSSLMSSICDCRGKHNFRCLHLITAVALFALLAAGRFRPNFVDAFGSDLSIRASASHDKVLRFNCDRSDNIALARAALTLPSWEPVSHLVPAPEGLAEFATKGFHYNRPPPLA
jgi:hypothetical protein